MLAAAAFATPVHAGDCDEETVGSVVRGGSVIILDSGGVCVVDPDDTSDTALWNAGDRVLMCRDAKWSVTDFGDKAHVAPVR
jgi:hypothetical protein